MRGSQQREEDEASLQQRYQLASLGMQEDESVLGGAVAPLLLRKSAEAARLWSVVEVLDSMNLSEDPPLTLAVLVVSLALMEAFVLENQALAEVHHLQEEEQSDCINHHLDLLVVPACLSEAASPYLLVHRIEAENPSVFVFQETGEASWEVPLKYKNQ